MYSNYYGFSHKPFELTPDPNIIYLSETHQEALAVLRYGVLNRKGFLQLTGDVGTGKSTLVQNLIESLESNVHLCYIPNPNFNVEEFYYYLAAKFGLDEFDGNKAKFILNLAQFLIQCRKDDELALLIIDEAHVLSLELLEEIRLLSNQEYTEFGVLSIFFVGQPEFIHLLSHQKLAPLRNRIGISFHINPLTLEETTAYILFRLNKAGRTTVLFSKNAFKEIQNVTGGIPRTTNILCDNALLAGFAEQRGIIDEHIIRECAAELTQADKEPTDKDRHEDGREKVVTAEHVPVKPNKAGGFLLLRRAVLIAVMLLVILAAITVPSQYLGRLPGAAPVKHWLAEQQNNESLPVSLREFLAGLARKLDFTSSDNNVGPEQSIDPVELSSQKKITRIVPGAETGSGTDARAVNDQSDKSPPENIFTSKEKPGVIVNGNKVISGGSTEKPGIQGAGKGDIDDVQAGKNETSRRQNGPNYTGISGNAGLEPTDSGAGKVKTRPDAFRTGVQQDSPLYASITPRVHGANIRSGPSMNDTILLSVLPGYPLRIVDPQENWTLVEDYKARKGWVATRLLVENNSAILMAADERMHSGPSEQDSVVSTLDYGAVLQIEGKQENWLKVRSKEGIAGWIERKNVWP